MPYTLSMGLLWVSLAVVLGVVIGWLMRSVVAKRQIERARSNHLDTVELDRLRARVDELEPAVLERDRLRADLDACRAAAALVSEPPGVAAALTADLAPDGATSATTDATTDAVTDAASNGDTDVDLSAAAAVLGAPVELDDLTVVEGIGPKVAELCIGIGIQTWRDLAQTEVSLLRTMLHDAGPRFRTHDPSTWPEQAALLAAGRWAEFAALTGQLAGGRPVE